MSIEMSESGCLFMGVSVLSMSSMSSLFLSLSMLRSLLSIWKGKSHNYLVGRGSLGNASLCPEIYLPARPFSLAIGKSSTMYL